MVERYIYTRINHITKLDFLAKFPTTYTAYYKSETIKNSFVATSLIPFNLIWVIETLNIWLKTPTPPTSSSSSDFLMKTPYNPR